MAEKPDRPAEPDGNDVFALDRIRSLVELMKEHELSEVDLKQSGKRIRLRRGQETAMFAMPSPAPALLPSSGPSAADASTAPPVSAADDDKATYITSPMVGTFYERPKPDAPSFVKVGDHVEADTIVCLIEAMKMFYEIPAGVSGKILQVLVKNEEAVDVNKPLFKVDPA